MDDLLKQPSDVHTATLPKLIWRRHARCAAARHLQVFNSLRRARFPLGDTHGGMRASCTPSVAHALAVAAGSSIWLCTRSLPRARLHWTGGATRMRRGGVTRSGSPRQRGSPQCAPPSVTSAPTSSPAVRLSVIAACWHRCSQSHALRKGHALAPKFRQKCDPRILVSHGCCMCMLTAAARHCMLGV